MSRETSEAAQVTVSRYRKTHKSLALDRWSMSEDYIRDLYGDDAADWYISRRQKEYKLSDNGQLQEYLAIEQDGFSEDAADEILGFSDEQQVEISKIADRLRGVMAIAYPCQAGKWLETKVRVLGGQRPLDIISSENEEAKVKLISVITILEKGLDDEFLPPQLPPEHLEEFFDLPEDSLE